MEIGIIGLPNTGKTTLFNALTLLNAETGKFQFTTIEPNIGTVSVPDKRLEKLNEIFRPKKLTYSTIKFVDIAGLIEGAHHGAGLGNKFLSHIRSVDALLQMLRAFSSEDVPNPINRISPEDEIGIVQTEIMLADLEVATNALEKIKKSVKSGSRDLDEKINILEMVVSLLNSGIPLRERRNDLNDELIKEYSFLSLKPIFYVINVDGNYTHKIARENTLYLDAKFEYEMMFFPEEERKRILKEFGYESKIQNVIEMAIKTLGLIRFYTVVGEEVKAWLLPNGKTVREAAGKIHSDMEKGFICAEIYSFDEVEKYGSEKKLYESGIMRTEGQNYVVRDGDIVKIKFQV